MSNFTKLSTLHSVTSPFIILYWSSPLLSRKQFFHQNSLLEDQSLHLLNSTSKLKFMGKIDSKILHLAIKVAFTS